MDNVNQKAMNEAFFGTIPTLNTPAERIYSFWDMVWLTGGYAIASWCYVQGGWLASMLTFKQLIFSTLFVFILGGLFAYTLTIISCRHGMDVFFFMRAIFGETGMAIMIFLIFVSGWGYSAINAQLYANSFIKILGAAGFELGPAWVPWLGSSCVIIGTGLAIRGPIVVKWATRIMVPSLLAVGAIMMFLLLKNMTWNGLNNLKPIDAAAYAAPYPIAVEWNLAYVLAWISVLGVIPRFAKSERISYWSHVLGFSIIMGGFVILGGMTGLVMAAKTGVVSLDPTEWLISLGGAYLGLMSVFVVAVANVTTTAIDLYSVTVSSKILRPTAEFEWVCLGWSAFILVLLFWGGIWRYYNTFLGVVGIIVGPILGLILTDYFLVRDQKISMKDAYMVQGNRKYRYTGGFNLISLACFALGVGAYIMCYDSINTMPKQKIFYVCTATGWSIMVSSLSYYLISKIPVFNAYMVPENH
ncbi:MAG: cytosine permease [Desulfobacterales bacterium]|nr:cytosine permease [Desulfobacterales bacterium]